MKRLKVLISAHEFSPDQGSECAVGWNLVTGLNRYHDVTVLYARGSQFEPDAYERAVTAYYANHPKPEGLEFIAIPQPASTLRIATLNKRLFSSRSVIGLPMLYYIGYRYWQKQVYRTARALAGPFDLSHHLTSISYREPGYLWKLEIPFVWGPTGGTTNISLPFYPHIGLAAASHETLRAISNHLTVWLSRKIHRAIQKSTLIYAFTAKDCRMFQRRAMGRVEIMLETGCGGEAESGLPAPGKVVPQPASRRISFTGWLNHDQVLEHMRQSDVLVHTSYREGTSHVIMEALSVGIPVICHDISGLSIAITEECGIKVPLRSYKESVAGFRQAIRKVSVCRLPASTRLVWCGRLVHSKALDILLKVLSDDPELLSSITLTIIGDGPLRQKYEQQVTNLLTPTRTPQSIIPNQQPVTLFQPATCNQQLLASLHTGALCRANELSWDSMAERIANDYNTITGNT